MQKTASMNKKNEANADSGDCQHPIASSSVNSNFASNASENDNNVLHGSMPLSSTKVGVRHIQEGESTRAGPSNLRFILKNEPVSISSVQYGAFARRPVAGFDPRNPQVPPGMTSTRAKNLANRISMLTSPQNYVVNQQLLKLSDGVKVKYARDMWAMVLYNVPITQIVLESFVKLAERNEKWAKVVLETMCFLRLREEFTDPPLAEVIIVGNITVPPEIDRNRALGFFVLFKFMERGVSYQARIYGLLSKSTHTKAFKRMFVDTLSILEVYNVVYRNMMKNIILELMSDSEWTCINNILPD